MANDGVFTAQIAAIDRAAGPVAKIIGSIKGLGVAADAIKHHYQGLAMVGKAAFGEMEHEAHGAGHAMHEAGAAISRAAHGMHATGDAAAHAAKEIHHAGEEAKIAGQHIAHAAHPRTYEALAAHFHLFRGRLGEVNMGLGQVGHSASELFPILGGLGAVASIEGLFEMTQGAVENFSQLKVVAAEAGTSMENFAKLSLAAKMDDVPIENMTTAMFKLGATMHDVVAGKNGNVRGLFEHLGSRFPNLRPAALAHESAADIMPDLAEAFKLTVDPNMRSAMAKALFGKGGESMLPMLMGGREEMEQFFKLSEKISFVPSKEQQEQLEAYHQSLVGLEEATNTNPRGV